MRKNNQLTPNKNTWEKGGQFIHAQRQKYQKSEVSVYQSQSSSAFYEQLRSQRHTIRPNSDHKEFFDNNIPVRVKSVDREDYTAFLRVQIIASSEKGISGVILHLTDDNNSLFLWNFFIKQSDFINLKTQQRLRVDFAGFPQMMVSHFQLLRNQKQVHPNEQNFFHCLFDVKKGGEATLNILESNKYKQSLHICLKFKNATDQQLKNYLSDKLGKEKDLNEDLRLRNSRLQDFLNQRKIELQTLSLKYKQEVEKYEKDIECFTMKQQQKITQLKQQMFNQKNKYTKDFQEQKKKDEQILKNQINTLRKQNQQIQLKLQNANEKNHNLQNQTRQMTHKLNSLQKENNRNFIDLQELKKNHKQIQTIKYSQENKITQLNFQIQGLKRQLMDKKSIICTTEELKSSTEGQIKTLDDKNKEYKKMLQKSQQKCEKALSELAKCNELYLQLKEKYQRRKEKLNEKNRILKLQEETVSKLQSQLQLHSKSQLTNKREKDALQMKIQDWQLRYKELKAKQEESQNKITQGQTLIRHLNKQLTQRIGGRQYLGGNLPSITPSISASRDLIGTNTESRMRYTNTSIPGDNIQKIERVQAPVIKRYTGTTPKHSKEDGDRTLSPNLGRLNQQTDPEDESEAKIKPVKFKYSGQ